MQMLSGQILANIAEQRFGKLINDEILQRQIEKINHSKFLTGILNAIPFPILILNNANQIIFVNREFFNFVIYGKDINIIGLKQGEALHCKNALTSPGGCGTTKFCKVCGIKKAILSEFEGVNGFQESVLTTIEGFNINVTVFTESFIVEGEKFYFLFLKDTSNEKRRRSLERIFFHDVMNDLGNSSWVYTIGKKLTQ